MADKKDGGVDLFLSNPKLLHCLRCHKMLTTTPYKCGYGHIICNSCKTSNNTCLYPCSSGLTFYPMGSLLESLKIACQFKKFGCGEMISYTNPDGHEKACKYKSFTCPLAGCDFMSSTELLSLHFTTQHPVSALPFSFDVSIEVELKPGVNFLVLQEVKKKAFFVLHRRKEHPGIAIWVSSMSLGSSSSFKYTVVVGEKLTLDSVTTNILDGVNNNDPPAKFLYVPSSFFATPDEFTLELTIHK